MKKLFLTLIIFLSYFSSQSQNIQLDFENLASSANTHQNLSTVDTLDFGVTFFPSLWDTSFGGFWSNGWAWSSETDSITTGFMNQYAAANGRGADSSLVYLVQYSSAVILTPQQSPQKLFINNSTYAYQSMKNGDAFSKKFGGVTGNDPDFFLLTIKGYKGGVVNDTVINFYLADYRFSINSQDYIIKDWTEVSLTGLGETDSITFSLSSTDNGTFGMNTPAYFCIDNYQYRITSVGLDELSTEDYSVYPNPSSDFIYFKNVTVNSPIRIMDINGKIVFQSNFSDQNLNISFLDRGVYFIQIFDDQRIKTLQFIKQ